MAITKWVVNGCVLTFLLSSNAWAGADPVAELSGLVNKLQEQMTQMQDTIRQQNDKIELLQSQVAERPTGGAMIAGGQATQGSFDENLRAKIGDADKWLKDLRFSGDFRLRYEAFHFTSASAAETDDRNRFRYRLRFGFDKKLGKEFNVGVGFISGETAGTGADSGLQADPTYTNTSFDNLIIRISSLTKPLRFTIPNGLSSARLKSLRSEEAKSQILLKKVLQSWFGI